MTLPTTPAAPATMATRFFLVSYLPTYAALLYLLVLVWADGGPGTSFKRAWRTATNLTAAQVVLLALLVTLVAVILMPFQLSLVRLLEGAWPGWLGGGLSTKHQVNRKHDLEAKEIPASSAAAAMRQAGLAGLRLRQWYPHHDHLVRATRLGNILAAMEDRAGRDYGLDAVVAWPRLYPLLGAEIKAIADDRRNTLDSMARLAVTAFAAAVATLVILWGAWWWLLLAAVPAAVAVLAYLGALRAALAYGETVRAAFDLHHLSFGATFGLARFTSLAAERTAYRQLCDLWRQSIPTTFTYGTPTSAPPASPPPTPTPAGGTTS